MGANQSHTESDNSDSSGSSDSSESSESYDFEDHSNTSDCSAMEKRSYLENCELSPSNHMYSEFQTPTLSVISNLFTSSKTTTQSLNISVSGSGK